MDQQSEYVPPSQYSNIPSTPLIQNSVPAMNRNQHSTPSTQDIQNLQSALKSVSNFVTCPYCKNQAITRTEKKCSTANAICCVFTLLLPWALFQVCRGKDLNCYDANHFCTRCGNTLANYHAC
jgi:hypothetical protein